MYFNFGIIVCPDGTEIVDRRRKTFYHQLTPTQMVEYIEMDVQLELMDKMQQEARVEAGHRQKSISNLLWKLACLGGLCG